VCCLRYGYLCAPIPTPLKGESQLEELEGLGQAWVLVSAPQRVERLELGYLSEGLLAQELPKLPERVERLE
jgi:hypothetical protein